MLRLSLYSHNTVIANGVLRVLVLVWPSGMSFEPVGTVWAFLDGKRGRGCGLCKLLSTSLETSAGEWDKRSTLHRDKRSCTTINFGPDDAGKWAQSDKMPGQPMRQLDVFSAGRLGMDQTSHRTANTTGSCTSHVLGGISISLHGQDTCKAPTRPIRGSNCPFRFTVHPQCPSHLAPVPAWRLGTS